MSAVEAFVHKVSPLSDWSGKIGDEYFQRNPVTLASILVREAWLRRVFAHMSGAPESILEIGAGLGDNLYALENIFPTVQLFATEPNAYARQRLNKMGNCSASDYAVQKLGFLDGEFDFVFTNGCLIHVPPDELYRAMTEIYRVSAKWILLCEYFADKTEHVPWRGSHIWKADFGHAMLGLFPSLSTVACQFEWRDTTGMDNATWWLFRKGDGK